jgi:uncharacterized protein YcgI (DUF1989 family)
VQVRGILHIVGPVCKAGDHVVLRANVDCVVVMGAYSNDLLNTNGGDPSDAAFEILP